MEQRRAASTISRSWQKGNRTIPLQQVGVWYNMPHDRKYKRMVRETFNRASVICLAATNRLWGGATIAIIGAIWRGWLAMHNRLWPGRPKATWFAQAIPTPPESDIYGQPDSDPNNAWRKDRGRWSNGKNMEVGDWFAFHFEKPRALSEVIVRSEGQRFPKRIKFLIKTDLKSQWQLMKADIPIDVRPHDEDTIFQYRFENHQNIAAIKLEIVEPTLEPRNSKGWSPAWAIYSMDFKEYKLFGCLLEGSIK
ncbi:MAG: hypothetical protein HYX87_04860 [Chloroflexi bacterium]|nr:hypothetical protein [Chloroflexota bacterium]